MIETCNFNDLDTSNILLDNGCKNWLIIGSSPAPEFGFTDKQIMMTLEEMGYKCFYIDPTTFDELEDLLKKTQFYAVYWEGMNGWKVYDKLKGLVCKKINAWYDDPILRMDMAGITETMQKSQREVSIFCWDSYWIDRLAKDYKIRSRLCHLAASPREYYTAELACEPKPIFIGSLHSPRKIADMQSRLVEPFITILNAVKEDLKKVPEFISWDQIEGHYFQVLGDGERRLYCDLCESDKRLQSWFRHCIWAMSKNEVRLRMLRAALHVSPVTMMGDTSHLNHANEQEIRYMIGDGQEKLSFKDTTGIKTEQLCMFNHWGWIHLQATDPQSVCEGFPYRVFQTIASGKVLLTDVKVKWVDHFNLKQEIIGYDNLFDMQEKLNALLKDKDQCKDIGRIARRAFDDNHTWKHRIEEFLK